MDISTGGRYRWMGQVDISTGGRYRWKGQVAGKSSVWMPLPYRSAPPMVHVGGVGDHLGLRRPRAGDRWVAGPPRWFTGGLELSADAYLGAELI